MLWEVEIFGERYEIEESEPYRARMECARLYKEAHKDEDDPISKQSVTTLHSFCRVRRKDDKRYR